MRHVGGEGWKGGDGPNSHTWSLRQGSCLLPLDPPREWAQGHLVLPRQSRKEAHRRTARARPRLGWRGRGGTDCSWDAETRGGNWVRGIPAGQWWRSGSGLGQGQTHTWDPACVGTKDCPAGLDPRGQRGLAWDSWGEALGSPEAGCPGMHTRAGLP